MSLSSLQMTLLDSILEKNPEIKEKIYELASEPTENVVDEIFPLVKKAVKISGSRLTDDSIKRICCQLVEYA